MNEIKTGKFFGRLPYTRVGIGPDPVLLINGGQGFMMRSDAARAAKDGNRMARLMPDGCSFIILNYDPEPGDISVASIADDVASVIRSELGGRCVLMGISYGAVIASHVAARSPELVEKLALVAGAPDFDTEGRERLRRQVDLARDGQLLALTREFIAVFRRPWLNLLLRLRLKLWPKRILERLSPPEAIIAYLEAMLAYSPKEPSLDTSKHDLLIFGGDRDQFFGEHLRAAPVTFGEAKVVILSGETHMAPMERGRDLKEALTAFL
ncbi:pimeloyl-ACP methyl ester carboxylesterase [Rhizobium aquaticum]|uniref:Pimeloyl-ACP methyl ester carboxylesterase n=1 Tax=Rhizobium aquaticum TaxID=1549636 RepID=A0ABV2IWV8_9HYPH